MPYWPEWQLIDDGLYLCRTGDWLAYATVDQELGFVTVQLIHLHREGSHVEHYPITDSIQLTLAQAQAAVPALAMQAVL